MNIFIKKLSCNVLYNKKNNTYFEKVQSVESISSLFFSNIIRSASIAKSVWYRK